MTTGAGAGAEAGAQASRTVLKIRCKSSSEYLAILVAAAGALARGFAPEGQAGWSDNSSPDSGGEKESGGAIEGAAEEATEGRSRRGRPWPQTEIILALIF